ncbi:MAG: hypothetical protein QM490_03810 [Candidatus Gracilibacteria bacterium]
MSHETNTPGAKRSKREENSIITHFVFYFVLIVGLAFFLITSIIPEILKIEKDKTATKELYSNIERVSNAGLDFNEFKKFSNSGEKDRVLLEILKNMSEDFYATNLINNTEDSYKEFLEQKIEELSSPKNMAIINDQTKQISTILPTYSIPAIDLGGDSLSDYKFVNYIESILETFGLSTKSSIGINKLKLVEEYMGTNNSGDSLDSNIFYIPLSLVLKGDKAGILDFLYFVENVGNVYIDNDEIVLSEEYGFLSQNGRKKVLEGEKYIPGYNILNHQMIDIEKISMEQHIDSSYIDREEKDFKDFIIESQGEEIFEINVNLMFYVKGQPAYKTEEFINNVFNKHVATIGLISDTLKDVTLGDSLRRKLIQQNVSLNQMNKEILSIKKALAKKEKIDELYKRAMKLDEIIDPIFKSLKD